MRQQNSVAKHKNTSLIKMTKSMMNAKGLIHTTAYLHNCSPTLALHNQMSIKDWHGWRPKVTLFKVFGCISYVHVFSQKGRKLSENNIKYIFVGNNMETKGYHFYDPITKSLSFIMILCLIRKVNGIRMRNRVV